MLCTDGHKAYNVAEHIRCLVHLAKNNAKHDQTLKALIGQGADEDTITQYLSECYHELKEKTISILKEKYPELVDPKGNFTGAVNTNAMEGGNFRVKWKLRVSYSNLEGYYGRTILALINDSMHTFNGGRPVESFANNFSNLTFRNIMNVDDNQQNRHVMVRSYDCNKMEWYEHSVPLEIYQQSLSNL